MNKNQILHLKESPSISFDIISINSGSISNKQTIQLMKMTQKLYL